MVAALAGGCGADHDSANCVAFSQEAWARAQGEERVPQAKVIVECGTFAGQTRAEVYEALGQPNLQKAKGTSIWKLGSVGIDEKALAIKFDAKGDVTQAVIFTKHL
jgi:hypothetical protein